MLALSHLDLKGRLLPTVHLNGMQQFIKINELTCCCGGDKLGWDGRHGPAERGEVEVGGAWCRHRLGGGGGWLVDPGGGGGGSLSEDLRGGLEG